MPALTRRAWAKVNLALSVGPPEPPGSPKAGWHQICSWMHAIDLADDLRVEHADGHSRFRIEWASDAPRPAPLDWPIDKDLAFRAHRLLESEVGHPLAINLQITKRIPLGGGLGGGSSDAAATLVALNTLFALGHSPADLRGLSARLGSDIAFFIDDLIDSRPDRPPRPAMVSGFGDRIERLDTGRAEHLVLFLLGFGCPTPDVYRAYDVAPRPLAFERVQTLAAARGLSGLFNDLDIPAAAIAPPLGPLRVALTTALHQPVHMTGSGSTLFTPARSAEEARTFAAAAAGVPGILPVVTRLV